MVKSKYSSYTYLGVILGIVTMIILIVFSSTIDLSENAKKIQIPVFIPLIIIFLLIVYVLYRVFKTSPQFEIRQDRIMISGLFHRKKEILINDILEIDLFAIGLYNGSATIVTKISLSNGKNIKLAAPNYKNMPELKQALAQFFEEKIKMKIEKQSSVLKKEYGEETFSGNPYISFNALLIYGLSIGVFISIVTSKKQFETAHLVIIPLVLTMFIALSYQLHYFIFSDGNLIVKNHFLPWINKQYVIKNIIVLNFEHHNKSSQSLRITTNDFKSKNFPAGSLRNKTWDELKEYIKNQGIIFID